MGLPLFFSTVITGSPIRKAHPMITPTLAICVKLSGPKCAHVLYRLNWWTSNYPEKTKDGLRWNANPTSWWAMQTGLSPTQVDRAIAKLKELKLIVVECRPRGALLKCRWIRLSDEFAQTISANLKGSLSDIAETNSAGGSETIPAPPPKPISKGSSKGELKASISALAGGDMFNQNSQGKLESPKVFNTAALSVLWRTEIELATGTWTAEFSKAECKFAADLIKKTAGQDLAGAVKLAIRYWDDFRYFVAHAKGINEDKVAEKPQIFTLMQHPTELIGFVKKQMSELAEKVEQDKKFAHFG
jgi:hypothetical protein